MAGNFEMKPDSGALFKNFKKEKDSHPDYRGECLIDGKEYEVSSWVNKTKKGTTYMSLKFKLKTEDEQASSPSSRSSDDEDMPF